jgi:hypothetical protein
MICTFSRSQRRSVSSANLPSAFSRIEAAILTPTPSTRCSAAEEAAKTAAGEPNAARSIRWVRPPIPCTQARWTRSRNEACPAADRFAGAASSAVWVESSVVSDL